MDFNCDKQQIRGGLRQAALLNVCPIGQHHICDNAAFWNDQPLDARRVVD
jgi:hypothetical protein